MSEPRAICQQEGCTEQAVTRGYCMKHYTRKYREGTFTDVNKHGQVKTCNVDGCERRATSRGLCTKHYQRLMRFGSVDCARRKV